MEEKNNRIYKFMVHCMYPQIREGFEENISRLPFLCHVNYTNLFEEGIVKKLRFAPDLIIILSNEGDSDFNLAFKVKVFAPGIPVLIILPHIPDTYYVYLKELGIDYIMQLPVTGKDIIEAIVRLTGYT